VVRARSVITGDAAAVRGRRCVVIGDGPTLTHGGMAFGAGTLFVRASGGTIVDPRPHLVGSLRAALEQYPHVALEIPALGYAPDQVRDLEASVNAVPADVVVDGSPADLARVVRFAKPVVALDYELDADSEARLAGALARIVPAAFAPR
jgi:predicted GTPase